MPDFSQLTERQREIYDFIRDKIESRGYGPTVREIGEGFDIKSPNGVMCHLKALEKKGLIKREELLGPGHPAGRPPAAARPACRCWAASPPARRSPAVEHGRAARLQRPVRRRRPLRPARSAASR